MIKAYLRRHRRPQTTLFNRPFQMLALRQIQAARRPDPFRLQPVLFERWQPDQAL